MKTGILLKDATSGDQILSARDNEVLISSNNHWNGFLLEHQVLEPNEYEQHEVIGHRLMINIGSPVLYETKENGKMIKEVYQRGDFKILSDKAENTPSWHGVLNNLAIAIDPYFALSVTNFDKIQFDVRGKHNDKVVSQLAFLLITELKRPLFLGKLYAESLISALVMHLACTYQHRGNRTLPVLKGKLSAAQVWNVTEFIAANLDTNLSIRQIAAVANLSEYHFCRLFKNTLGISPHQFGLKLKLDRSKQLIKGGNSNLSAIAVRLGFNDLAHFSRVFKDATGFSPKSFQKIN